MARRVYVDTSAYMAIVLGEEHGREMEREMRDSELLTSVLLFLESMRSLVRLSRQGVLEASRFQDLMERVVADRTWFRAREVTLELCMASIFPILSTPRSLDLVHLRTAVRFHQDSPLTAFLSLDRNQLQAARELGLPS